MTSGDPHPSSHITLMKGMYTKNIIKNMTHLHPIHYRYGQVFVISISSLCICWCFYTSVVCRREVISRWLWSAQKQTDASVFRTDQKDNVHQMCNTLIIKYSKKVKKSLSDTDTDVLTQLRGLWKAVCTFSVRLRIFSHSSPHFTTLLRPKHISSGDRKWRAEALEIKAF